MIKDGPEFLPLSKVEQTFIQKVTGKLLCLRRAIDSTLLTPLSVIALQQAAPIPCTMQHTKQLLDYIASQASEMILAARSDAGYHNEHGKRTRAGGHFYLSNNAEVLPNNGSIHNVAQIIKAVMSSAEEAELGHCSSMPGKLYTSETS